MTLVAAPPDRAVGVLDPVDRASEILFGLIMVVTFTASLSVAEAGRDDVRSMLIGAVGCNLAWAIIDAVMYLMGVRAANQLATEALRAIQAAADPAAGRAMVADALPAAMLPALSTTDFERIRQHLLRAPPAETRLGRRDYAGAVAVFALVFACTFPVVTPFLIWQNAATALAASNAVAIVTLFVTGFMLGRHYGRPWRVGFAMVAVGVALPAIAILLGG